MKNLFGKYIQGDCFEKHLLSLYRHNKTTESEKCFSSASIIKLRSIVGSIETWGEQPMFYFWRYSLMTCHELSKFNSRVFILDFTWNCCRLQERKRFSRNQGQFKCVTKETGYHLSISELLILNIQSQVAELLRRPTIIRKKFETNSSFHVK